MPALSAKADIRAFVTFALFKDLLCELSIGFTRLGPSKPETPYC